jgi:hydroxymethylbilane synthase
MPAPPLGMNKQPIRIATRGSALALAQAHIVLELCRRHFPERTFEIVTIKTTGDKLQTASLANANLPKGLFTKELEQALLNGEADLAVHSLKDLPTELPAGLKVGAVLEREDVRDVLICRRESPWVRPGFGVRDLPQVATVATSSTRRAAQLREARADLNIVPIRGNVPTRLRKLAQQTDIHAIVLAAAGLARLQIYPAADGLLTGPEEVMTPGLYANYIPLDEMLPCVGQGAIGIEIREDTAANHELCGALNHSPTFQCVTAERAFLRAMGGGCQIAVAAHTEFVEGNLRMRAVSFLKGAPERAAATDADPAALGEKLAARLR